MGREKGERGDGDAGVRFAGESSTVSVRMGVGRSAGEPKKSRDGVFKKGGWSGGPRRRRSSVVSVNNESPVLDDCSGDGSDGKQLQDRGVGGGGGRTRSKVLVPVAWVQERRNCPCSVPV